MDLLEISRLMRTQSNRHTQFPLFIIQEEQEVPKAHDCGNLTKYFNGDTLSEMTVEQYEAIDDYQNEDKVDENDIDLIKLLEDVGYEALEDIDLTDWREVCYDRFTLKYLHVCFRHRWHNIHSGRIGHETVYHTQECMDCKFKRIARVHFVGEAAYGNRRVVQYFPYTE